MTFNEFIPLFGQLEAVFGDQPEAKALIYFDVLKAVDVVALQSAIVSIVQTADKFPMPKQILDNLPGSASPKVAAKAGWMQALDAATNGPFSEFDPIAGTFPTGDILNDVTFRAIGGVAGLCNLQSIANDATKLSFAERDFCDHFDAIVSTEPEAVLSLNLGREQRQLPSSSHEPRQIGDIASRVFDERPRAMSTVHYAQPELQPCAIPTPKLPYEPQGSQLLDPETLQHDDNAHPWGGVRNALRRRLYFFEFQLVMRHIEFQGVNENRRTFTLKVDPITWQTLSRDNDYYRIEIERAVCEWCGTSTWTVNWALTV